MTAPAQILANALQAAVDAVCNFARFVVNESRTRLTPPPPPPPLGICGSISAAVRFFLLALLLTLAGVFAAPALAHSDSCPSGQSATRLGNVCVETKFLGFGDWCEQKIMDSGYTGVFIGANPGTLYGASLNGPNWCIASNDGAKLPASWCNPFRHAFVASFHGGGSLGTACDWGGKYSDGTCGPATNPHSYNPNTHSCTCPSGFTADPEKVCQTNKDCSSDEGRVQVNPYTCGACLDGFTPDPQNVCQANKDCRAEGLSQANEYTCGICLFNFTEDPEGMCQANQDCKVKGQVQTNPYTCGACLSGFTEGSGGACNCPDGNVPGKYGDCNTPRHTDETACTTEDENVNPIGGSWSDSDDLCRYPSEHFKDNDGAACFESSHTATCLENYLLMRQLRCVARGLLYVRDPLSSIRLSNHCICPSTGERSTSSCPDLAASVSVFISASTNGTVSAEWAEDSDLQNEETVPSGTTVTFTASPDNGYELARWTGDCLGDSVGDSQCALAVTMEVTVGAEFELLFFEVSLAASDNGTVSAGWQGDANLQSGEEVSFGATVTFTASPADGYELTLWTGACAGEAVDSPCVLEVMMNATVGAGFGCLDFHESAATGNLVGLKCNVDAGADVNAPDESGKTPLHLAAGEGHLEVVRELLTLGATLNASDDDGDTPLTEAAENDNVEIFNLLAMEGGTHEGAECGPGEVPNPNGKTPPCESCEADEIVSNGVCESCGRNEVASGGACECASGYEAIGGTCIHPENRLPEDETTCADAFGGDWVDLSAEHGEGKGVCSGIDINDTFCLAGTVSALPCLGLFNHVRSCNLVGRPALDPWHCGKACAGGKASGARCLELE